MIALSPAAAAAAGAVLAASGARTRLERLVDETLESASVVAAASVVPSATRELLAGVVDAVRERIP